MKKKILFLIKLFLAFSLTNKSDNSDLKENYLALIDSCSTSSRESNGFTKKNLIDKNIDNVSNLILNEPPSFFYASYKV